MNGSKLLRFLNSGGIPQVETRNSETKNIRARIDAVQNVRWHAIYKNVQRTANVKHVSELDRCDRCFE
jgi:hypothetical protein